MSRTARSHPQLKTPLVKEAVLEVRYPSSDDLPYGIIPGRLYEALKSDFKKPLELPLAKVPVELGPDHVVRHRFLSEDESRMFQVGIGVISINHVKYAGFPSFAHDCRNVLEAAIKDIGLVTRVNRIGLRYINKAPLDRPWREIIQVEITAPDIIESAVQARLYKWLTDFPEVGILSTTMAWPTIENKVRTLVIDLDHYTEPQKNMSVEQIMKWLDAAHENVYKVFKNSLTPEYFTALQEG